MRHFVAGFCLSLVSVSLGGHLYSSASAEKIREYPKGDIKIDLFKTNTSPLEINSNLFAAVKKQSFTPKNTATEQISNQPQPSITYDEVNGIEDDEILSINVADIIPIEHIDAEENVLQAEVLHTADDNISAMLPDIGNEYSDNSPWVIAKGSKHIKNKRFLEEMNKESDSLQLADTFNQQNDEEVSYKVAEKIKQSIIFPIPDEILNDENLTPTFIHNTNRKKAPVKKEVTPAAPKPSTPEPENTLKIVTKVPTQESPKKEENTSGILTSLSSWFSNEPAEQKEEKAPVQRVAPSYSSQGQQPKASKTSFNPDNETETNEFVKFYETLQETTRAHEENRIVPAELKLSFQPGRAEISGNTLRWLKAFSESVIDGESYLEVRIDSSAPLELQRKRLNLLYTIFMNNGVDMSSIETIFSLNEPNAFIIRTLRYE